MTIILAADGAHRGFGGPVALLVALAVFGVFVWYVGASRPSPPPPGPDAPLGGKTAGSKRAGWRSKIGGGGDVDLEEDYEDELDPTREHTGYSVSYEADGVTRVITPRYADDQD